MFDSPIAKTYLLAGLGSLVVFALTYMFILSPKLEEASALGDQTASVEASIASLQDEVARLEQQTARLPELKAAFAKAQLQIPNEPEIGIFIQSLQTVALATGVKVELLAPGSGNAPKVSDNAPAAAPLAPSGSQGAAMPMGKNAPKGASPIAGSGNLPANTPAGNGSSAAGGAAPSAAPAGTVADAGAALAVEQARAAGTTVAAPAQQSNLMEIPLNLEIVGEYFEVANFFKKFQSTVPRAYLISSLAFSPDLGPSATNPDFRSLTKSRVKAVVSGALYFMEFPPSVTGKPDPATQPETPGSDVSDTAPDALANSGVDDTLSDN